MFVTRREAIRRRPSRPGAAVEDAHVDHRGADVLVPEEPLNGADVVSRLPGMRREQVQKAVAWCVSLDSRDHAAAASSVSRDSRAENVVNGEL